MSTVKISQAVGAGQVNKYRDVKTIQTLLNSNRVITKPGSELKVDGLIGDRTISRIREFQEKVVRLKNPDGIVSPYGPTIRNLHNHSSPIALEQTNSNDKSVSEELYVSAAKALNCEVAAIKSVVITESQITGPFDSYGRPTILYERHIFSGLTNHKFDGSHPEISGPKYKKYGTVDAQYKKLQAAMELDKGAALKSASWGAFQIMGGNFSSAGYASIDAFVEGMQTINGQTYAFVNHIKNTPVLLHALQNKNWARFARYYNGESYKENDYDTKLSANYNYALHH
ncbi:N-acetylmuramidase family protein [Erwinia endophytica]|uniref:N-acetylmuramidase domain-containing protein n=1 Tax=Erwinia endophytica TaxID=1563158 RepID=UPI001265DFD1|nr:N-acetylmuramidase family protein [Erwinia endophytica]KAB8310348.1 N-acetylmuramidase family protein [Erwinia endophytica]